MSLLPIGRHPTTAELRAAADQVEAWGGWARAEVVRGLAIIIDRTADPERGLLLNAAGILIDDAEANRRVARIGGAR